MHLTEHQLRKKVRNILRELFGLRPKGGSLLQRTLGANTQGRGGGWGDDYGYDELDYDLRSSGYGSALDTDDDDGDDSDDGDGD